MTPSKKPERGCDSMEVTLFNRGWNAAIDATTPPAAPVQLVQEPLTVKLKENWRTDDFGKPIIYDTNEVDEVTGALTGDEGEEDALTVLNGTPLANDIAVWMASFAQEHTTLPAQPSPVQPVAFEVGLVEWVGNKLMATPKTTTTPPASWVEMVTANLVREGVNKHKARELAEHFYGLAQRPFVGLTDDDLQLICTNFRVAHGGWVNMLALEIEAKLRSKNENNN